MVEGPGIPSGPAVRRAVLEWVDDVLRRRSVRGVQAVRIGGQPVHHRVPLLRAPAAPARSQAAARARPERIAARRARRWPRGCGGSDPRRLARAPAPLALAGGGPLGRLAAVRDDRAGGGELRARGWRGTPGPCCTCDKLAIVGPLHGDWWKLFTSQFAYGNGLYAFVALVAIGDLRLAAGAPPRAGGGAGGVLRRGRDGGAGGERGLLRAGRQRRQRRRPRPAGGLGGPRPAGRARGRRLRGRSAGRGGDRRAAAGDAVRAAAKRAGWRGSPAGRSAWWSGSACASIRGMRSLRRRAS